MAQPKISTSSSTKRERTLGEMSVKNFNLSHEQVEFLLKAGRMCQLKFHKRSQLIPLSLYSMLSRTIKNPFRLEGPSLVFLCKIFLTFPQSSSFILQSILFQRSWLTHHITVTLHQITHLFNFAGRHLFI